MNAQEYREKFSTQWRGLIRDPDIPDDIERVSEHAPCWRCGNAPHAPCEHRPWIRAAA